MRMWNVDPKLLCRSHLLGEHREMHALVGMIKKNISLQGYIDRNLIETDKIKERHDLLVVEMLRRNYNHHTPIVEEPLPNNPLGYVDVSFNITDLKNRCTECKNRIEKFEREGCNIYANS